MSYRWRPDCETMAGYELTLPEGLGEIRVTCTDHGRSQQFPKHRRTVAFHCPDCGREVEITLHDRPADAYSERC